MPATPTAIKGFVKDEKGVGITGARVSGALGVGTFTTVTAPGGGYFASWIGAGVMTITAAMAGYTTGTASVTLTTSGGKLVVPDIKLTKLP